MISTDVVKVDGNGGGVSVYGEAVRSSACASIPNAFTHIRAANIQTTSHKQRCVQREPSKPSRKIALLTGSGQAPTDPRTRSSIRPEIQREAKVSDLHFIAQQSDFLLGHVCTMAQCRKTIASHREPKQRVSTHLPHSRPPCWAWPRVPSR